MLRVRVYSRKECHLCDDAKQVLKKFAAEYPLAIEEIDIDHDPEAQEKYREEIPVIFLEDTKLFKYRVEEEAFRKAIEARLRGPFK